jgi:hypothetical protein
MSDVIQRLARMSFTFVMLNAAAVSGLVALGFGKRVWR